MTCEVFTPDILQKEKEESEKYKTYISNALRISE